MHVVDGHGNFVTVSIKGANKTQLFRPGDTDPVIAHRLSEWALSYANQFRPTPTVFQYSGRLGRI